MNREASTETRTDDGLSTPLPAAIAAVVPPLVALAVHLFSDQAIHAWSLFLGAVLLSAWLGGFKSGLAATALSTVLVLSVLLPHERPSATNNIANDVTAMSFIALGIVLSLVQRRFQRAQRDVQAALAVTRHLNEQLAKAVADRDVFAALIENSSDFIGIADTHGKPTYINAGGRHMVGFPPDVPLASTAIQDFYPPDLHEFARNVIVKTMFAEGHWEGETRFRHWRTGASIPVSDSHFVIRDPATKRMLGTATITHDLSAIKRAQSAIEAANQRLQRVTEDLREAQRIGRIGSWYYDPKTDRTEWSDELLRIHDRRAEDLPETLHGPNPLFTPEGLSILDAATQKLLHDGCPYEADVEAVRADGSTGWVSIRAIPVRNKSGEIVGITGTTQDITELKKLQKLRQEWMSVVAHDLRQPIGVIRMAADLLPDLHNGKMSSGEENVARRIRTASLDLSRMVDDLLDVSRLEAHRLTLDRSWLDPRMLIDDTVDRLSHLTTGVHVKVTGPQRLPRVYADAGRIGQVLGNLISNAIKYGDKDCDIEIHLADHEDTVIVSVTNQGKGIAPEELQGLFSRFARTRDDRTSRVPGLGLGLYIAKGLIDAHAGRIWGESIPGKTTTFSFTLPTRDTAQAQAA